MRNHWYKPRDGAIGEHSAIKHTITGELALVGKYGEIWQVNEKLCRAIIHSTRIAKKYLPEDKHPIQPGDEILITFPLSDLSIWIERLKVTRNRNGMIRLADWFGDENES